MEQKKPSLEGLAERVEELLVVLNYVAKDLSEVSAKLKEAVQAVKPTAQPPKEKPTEKPVEKPTEKAEKILTAQEVAIAFPEDLEKLLKFEDKGEFIMIKPSAFLGSEKFARIADIVRNRFNGDYVSLGKESHFRVPKKQEVIEN